MHIPSSDVYPQLQVEPAGIWFVPTMGDDTHAILLKSPSNILKAIIKRASIKLGFSIEDTPGGKILLSIMYIKDNQDSPVITISEHTQDFQLSALVEILTLRTDTPIFFYDELTRNVAEAKCEFDESKDRIIDLIDDINNLYVGPRNSDIESAITSLVPIAEGYITKDSLALERVVASKLTLKQFDEFDFYAVGLQETSRFNITDEDEGGGLEQSIWHLLEGLFEDKIYRSPQVTKKDKIRELTDVLAISEHGIFLIESKATAVLSISKEKTSSRQAKSIESKIKKALRQLVGATKSIRKGLRIITGDNQEIEINREILPHAIVLLSEMHPAIDWDTITIELFKKTINSKAIFHILDLRELSMLVGRSKTVNYLDYFLMERAKEVVNAQSAFIRTKVITAESEPQSKFDDNRNFLP